MTSQNREPIIVPYNEAGKRAFEVFYRIAERLYAGAQAAANEYMALNYPQSVTVEERHADGQYRRTIRTATGDTQTICYDYVTKRIVTA